MVCYTVVALKNLSSLLNRPQRSARQQTVAFRHGAQTHKQYPWIASWPERGVCACNQRSRDLEVRITVSCRV